MWCCCTGRVTAVAKLQVTVELPFKLYRLTDQIWRLQKLGNIVTYERSIAALLRVAHTSNMPASGIQALRLCCRLLSLLHRLTALE